MVKHTKTIRRQQPTNCFSVLEHFVRFALKGLRNYTVAVWAFVWKSFAFSLSPLSFPSQVVKDFPKSYDQDVFVCKWVQTKLQRYYYTSITNKTINQVS